MSNVTYTIPVSGMHCAACELLIEKKVASLKGVQDVDAQLGKKLVKVVAEKTLSEEQIVAQANEALAAHGYQLRGEEKQSAYNWRQLWIALLPAVTIVGAIIALDKLGLVNFISASSMSLPVVFVIGVAASLSTCMASVGGLVLSLSSTYSRHGQSKVLIPFHLARLVSFTLFGALIGLVGSQFVLGDSVRLIITGLLSLLMLTMGLYLLDVPWAKRMWGKLPTLGLGKKTHLSLQAAAGSNASWVFAAVLGASTFFLPCGFTQSMQWYALGLADPWLSSLTLLVFALGTFPVLAGISVASARISSLSNNGLLFKSAGWLVILFALYNVYAIALPYLLLL